MQGVYLKEIVGSEHALFLFEVSKVGKGAFSEKGTIFQMYATIRKD